MEAAVEVRPVRGWSPFRAVSGPVPLKEPLPARARPNSVASPSRGCPFFSLFGGGKSALGIRRTERGSRVEGITRRPPIDLLGVTGAGGRGGPVRQLPHPPGLLGDDSLRPSHLLVGSELAPL